MSDYPEPLHHDDLALETAQPRLKRPPLYRVLLLNDDYTTMEFVVRVLQAIFHHPEERAAQIMLHVHQRGAGICGVYTREIAESKVEQVLRYAQEHEHPLQCTMEPDTDDEGDTE
ncbi:MAG: ATP-dependent Clp protease adapter ClpS [Gammaproteobacteria bacterium]|nr:ATP-dependent Clp protease adapter ClpS [Gammaproteobacteria bacterium]